MIIIHAFVILLTYATMIPNATPYLDYWFPQNAPLPHAFVPETNEPAPIFPDWLKLKMIRSSVDRLIDAALQDATPQQIVLFIQSFGTPVNSMSKLLALLDLAVIEQTNAVKDAIDNGAYFAQVIEIQQARGAKYGHIAIQTLQLNDNVVPDSPKRDIVVTEQLEIPSCKPPPQVNSSQTKEIEEVVDTVLHNESISHSVLLRFRRLVQQMLTTDGQHHLAKQQQNTVSKVLQYLSRNAKSQHIYERILQSSAVCSFFRTLFVSVQEKSSNQKSLASVNDDAMEFMISDKCPIIFQMIFNKGKQFFLNFFSLNLNPISIKILFHSKKLHKSRQISC